MPDFYALPFDITCIDSALLRPNMTAFYLLEAGDEAAFIETGTQHSVATALALLKQKNIAAEKIRYIIPTHVHLDHAGGAGKLMQLMPNAQLLIHPRGARHMVDPGKLWAGATAVYGEAEMQRLYGEVLPIAKDRLRIMQDGEKIDFNGRILEFIDTPGHARHHFCIWDQTSQGWFTGDTFGIAYSELSQPGKPFIFPTTTPVQFDPPALLASLDRLMSYAPQRLYLTHFGMVEQPRLLVPSLRRQIEDYQQIARAHQSSNNRIANIKQALLDYTLRALQAHGSPLSSSEAQQLLDTDMMLNAQGLDFWLGH